VFVLVVLFAPDGIVGAWTRYAWAPLLRRLGAREAALAAEAATSAASASVVTGDGTAVRRVGAGAPRPAREADDEPRTARPEEARSP
jgi:hypothetical protein